MTTSSTVGTCASRHAEQLGDPLGGQLGHQAESAEIQDLRLADERRRDFGAVEPGVGAEGCG